VRTIQPQDTLALRSAADAQPSPDGQHIAYVVTELDGAADRARSSVWLVAAGGGTPRLITGPTESSSQPRWSPDGHTLAFIADGERGAQIWLLDLHGGNARTPHDTGDQPTPLTEGGTQLTPLTEGGTQGISLTPGGTVPIPLTDVSGGVTGPPVWSPDGRRIAFTARIGSAVPGAPRVIRRLRYLLNGDGYIGDGFWHVFSVPVDTARPAAATQHTSGEWHHFAPAWSPDGTHIMCVSTRRDDWDTEWIWDIYVLDAQDSAAPPRCLTDSQRVCAAPAWSPDGQWIAYYANECPFTAYTQDYYFWLVPSGGGTARMVSRALDRGCQVSQPPSTNEPPHWSADSTIVFIHVREAGFFHYYAYHLADDALHPVRNPSNVQEPIAGLVRMSRDGGVLALTAATGVRPSELYTFAPDGTDCRQLTDLNGPALASLQLRAPERITHTSPEGWQVETWLWLPPAYRTGDAPLPAVVYFHGGPHNSVALGFNEQLHVLAGAGFAVVAVNFRGSTGFGAAFADSILQDWGPRELADGLAIVDMLVEQGIVDAGRLGAYGGSYGGFMTNLALARTDRFAAGVSFATISGLDSWAYITDHWESVDWDSGGPPWQIPDYYRTHSPMTYVADITAPLLIMHGEEDYRCSVAEADQLFGALRKLKRNVELVRYPGGSHAFSHIGPPSHRLDAMQRVLDWFQRYL
jgi:dipeptidyl aminopeptidase/acylaminoacyl peptidase